MGGVLSGRGQGTDDQEQDKHAGTGQTSEMRRRDVHEREQRIQSRPSERGDDRSKLGPSDPTVDARASNDVPSSRRAPLPQRLS